MNRLTHKADVYFKTNKSIFLVLFIALFLGILTGVFVLLNNLEYISELKNYSDRAFSVFTLNVLDKKDIFFNYVLSDIEIIVFIWISGLFVFLIPFSFFQVFLKGLRMGCLVALWTKAYGIKGVFCSFIANITSFLFIVPLILIYSVFKIKNLHYLKTKDGLRRIFNKNDLLNLGAAILVILFAGFIDAYVISDILKAFTGYFM